MTSRFYRLLGLAWLALILALGLFNTQTLFVPGKIQFDILALLPEGQTEKMRLSQKLMDDANIAGRVVILFGHKDGEKAKLALQNFRSEIASLTIPLVEQNFQQLEADYKKLFTNLYPYRAGLLAQADHQLLVNGQGDTLVKRAIGSIMSPFGSFTSEQIASDPFGFFPQFVTSLQKYSSLNPDATGQMFINSGGKIWYVFQGHLTDKIFSLKLQEKISESIWPIFDCLAQNTGVEVLKVGGAFYAAAGAQQARNEISEIGFISSLGIILLLLLIFNGLRPILLATVVVISGLVGGLSACLLLFGSIHILALVFGCSLVGVAVDYALHYYCASYKQENSKSIPHHKILSTLLPALPLGVITSSIGYGLLIVAPFPGIQQMAVLACVGLLCAFISVSLWGTYFIKSGERAVPALAKKVQYYLEKLAAMGSIKHLKLIASVLIITIFCVGTFNLKFDDNVRHFQSLNPQLKNEEEQIKSMMSFDHSSKFIAVTAPTLEDVLKHEEIIMIELDNLGVSYHALAQLIPSQRRQQENTMLNVEFSQTHFPELAKILGIGAFNHKNPSFDQADFKPEDFLKQLPTGWRELIDTSQKESVTGRILLTSPLGESKIGHLIAAPGIQYVDPIQEYSILFASYRQVMMLLTITLLCGFTLLIAFRQGIRPALTMTMPVFMSTFATVGIIGATGVGFSMFHAMGLILVLCIGIDYALFLYWRKRQDAENKDLLLLGNAMAAVTTILSFGLLSLSTTSAVNSFGFTVFIGIFLNFFITTLFLGNTKCKKL